MDALTQIGRAITEVHDKVGPAVVGIGNRWRGGSGIVIDANRVLTNAHNLHGDEVQVFFDDGRRADGRILGADTDGDLAVLEVATPGATPLTWTDDSDVLVIGTPVVALGNPGGNGARVTFGFVSGVERSFRGPRGRRIAGGVEHTAPLAPGSSGGPIVDTDGRLLGVNTNRVGGGFYLALPADAALRSRVEQLGRGETPRRRRLGVGLAPAHVARRLRQAVGLPGRDGLLVREVEEGSPAASAGIAEGDLIVAAADRPVADADDLFEALGSLGADEALEVTLVRGTEERTLKVVPE
jgi:serine protease Do